MWVQFQYLLFFYLISDFINRWFVLSSCLLAKYYTKNWMVIKPAENVHWHDIYERWTSGVSSVQDVCSKRLVLRNIKMAIICIVLKIQSGSSWESQHTHWLWYLIILLIFMLLLLSGVSNEQTCACFKDYWVLVSFCSLMSMSVLLQPFWQIHHKHKIFVSQHILVVWFKSTWSFVQIHQLLSSDFLSLFTPQFKPFFLSLGQQVKRSLKKFLWSLSHV